MGSALELLAGLLRHLVGLGHLGHRHAHVSVRVDSGVVNPDLIMQVRAGAASADSHVSNHLAASDALTRNYRHRRHVCIQRGDSMAVIQNNFSTISGTPGRARDDRIASRMNRSSRRSGNVDSAMELTLVAGKRIVPLAEGTGDASHDRPQCRRIG